MTEITAKIMKKFCFFSIVCLLAISAFAANSKSVSYFGKTLDKMGKKIDIKIYDDAGHAFENPNNKDGYRPEDAADAWKRTVSFFAETLKN
jgi:dienelactone hydrolase